MLDHVSRALHQVTEDVVVAGRETANSDLTAVPDLGEAHRGPLAGLAAVRAEHPDSQLVVVAVDQPWIRPATLEALVSKTSTLPVLPVDAGVRQTTCAVYPGTALDGIDDELAGGGSIQSLLDRVSFVPVTEDEWAEWGEDGRSWYSADTVSALDAGIARFGTP